MKKCLVLFSFVLFFATFCTPVHALNNWTVMLYFVSDDTESNAMTEAHITAINGLAQLGNRPNDYEMVVLFDRPKEGAWRFTFENGKCNVDSKMGQTNMGSPYTLWNFLKYSTEKHPAKQYALIIAGHGSGIFSWRGTGGVKDPNPGTVDFNPDKFVAYDDTDNDCLTVFEIQSVLEAFKSKLNAGKTLSLLSFDSCMPGSIEALYQLSHSTEVMVSSPETTLIGGVPYKEILSQLAANSTQAAEDFGKAIAKGYVQHANSMANRGEVSGVFRPALSEKIVGAVDILSIELLKAWQSGNKAAFKNLMTYGENKRYWDLGTVLKSIVAGNTDVSGLTNGSAIKQAAQDALDAIKNSNVTTWYSGKFADNKVAGLSIAWPEKKDYVTWHKFYKALALSKTTHWDEFLDAYFGI